MRRWLASRGVRAVQALRLAAGAAAALLALRPATGQAQVVRGTVRDAASGAPLAGVIVALYRASGSATDDERLVATLTDADGGYALTPNDTGRFVVTAKRIGVRRFQSPAIALARGQTHRLDITLEGVRFDLPVVTVSGATPCNTRSADRARIAALWEEARTALTASELSLRERLFRARITRYHRILEPRSLTVRHESRDVRQGVTEHAFESFAAESLAVHGYARMLPDGEIEYFAPDERVLLSGTFVRDHCFALARDEGNGETGITFVPVRTRRVTDIEGTIWLDARSYELRRVTFRYTNFPMPLRDPRVGGEVQFTRLARGAWHVSRWFMRVPQMELRRDVSGTARTGRVVTDRPVLTGFAEDGGHVIPDEARGAATMAQLNGRVVDSSGRAPLAGARVTLAGMDHSTVVQRDGSFRLADIPAGSYTLLVEHDDYARFGIFAVEQVLTIDEGRTSTTLAQALGTSQILRQLCGYDEVPDSVTAVRILLPPDAPTDSAAPRVAHLSWGNLRVLTPTIPGGMVRTTTLALDLPADAAGGVTACALPREKLITVEERFANGALARRYEFRTPERGFLVVQLRAP
ncbi:MAG: carboxypeptidase regulatory-like domain-containing protein [Gemmatimonadetes bacterium]|nr:carboxypeptidase regulatory-like domain-containing protein [Gemmatimonadota bacterium]